jgi:hypothetical protein
MPKARILSVGRKIWVVPELNAAVDALPYDGGDIPNHGWE